jgi:DNA invertase Pin-like site-specific DNA recombinase
MKERAIIYTRYSPRPNETQSAERQLHACRSYCEMRGFQVARDGEYCDPEETGAMMIDKRPQGARMMKRFRKRPPDAQHMIVHDISRLGRDLIDVVTTVKYFKKRKIQIHFVNLGGNAINAATPAGMYIIQGLAAFAEYQRADISERTREDVRRRQAMGQLVSRRPPYGMKVDDRTGIAEEGKRQLVVDEDARRVIDEIIIPARKDKATYQQIANTLNRQKIPSPGGAEWAKAAVKRVCDREEDRKRWVNPV